jgi:hypothetical protein
MLTGIKIILTSFILSIFLISVIHFFGNWNARFDPNHSEITDKAVGYYLDCLFKKHHYSQVDGPILGDFVGHPYKFNIPKVKASIKETFDDHLSTICYLWIGFMILLYFFAQVK